MSGDWFSNLLNIVSLLGRGERRKKTYFVRTMLFLWHIYDRNNRKIIQKFPVSKQPYKVPRIVQANGAVNHSKCMNFIILNLLRFRWKTYIYLAHNFVWRKTNWGFPVAPRAHFTVTYFVCSAVSALKFDCDLVHMFKFTSTLHVRPA